MKANPHEAVDSAVRTRFSGWMTDEQMQDVFDAVEPIITELEISRNKWRDLAIEALD